MVPGIHISTGPYEDVSLSDSIILPKAAYGITLNESNKQIDTNFYSPEYVRHLIASDCRRLAVSCLQSVNFLWTEDTEKFALPWTLIRLYYSAFYAAHVIVRLLGFGCCWLDSVHTKKLTSVVRIYNNNPSQSFAIDAGSYQCQVTDNAMTLKWTKSSQKGAHESLWYIFYEVIRRASTEVISGQLCTYDTQQVFAKLEEFRRLMTENQSFSWLSRTRNELQYRMEHDVWHATKLDKNSRLRLKKMADKWQEDPMNIDLLTVKKYGILDEFTISCAFIISIFRVMIIRVEELDTSNKGCFVKHGPRSLLNDFKLKI
jgi:hypothetical protein